MDENNEQIIQQQNMQSQDVQPEELNQESAYQDDSQNVTQDIIQPSVIQQENVQVVPKVTRRGRRKKSTVIQGSQDTTVTKEVSKRGRKKKNIATETIHDNKSAIVTVDPSALPLELENILLKERNNQLQQQVEKLKAMVSDIAKIV